MGTKVPLWAWASTSSHLDPPWTKVEPISGPSSFLLCLPHAFLAANSAEQGPAFMRHQYSLGDPGWASRHQCNPAAPGAPLQLDTRGTKGRSDTQNQFMPAGRVLLSACQSPSLNPALAFSMHTALSTLPCHQCRQLSRAAGAALGLRMRKDRDSGTNQPRRAGGPAETCRAHI